MEVVDRETLYVMFERVQSAGSDHPSLPHPAPEEFSSAASFGYKRFAPDQAGADRCTEPFAEADTYRVKGFGKLLDGQPGSNRCVEQSGSIQMGQQSLLLGPPTNGIDGGLWKNRAPSSVGGVFEAKQTRSDHVFVVWSHQSVELLKAEHPASTLDGSGDQSAQLCECPLLVVVDVTVGFAQKLVPRRAVDPKGDLIGHGAAGHENRRFLSEQLRTSLLQSDHGGIDIDDIITHRSVHHRLEHRGCRASYCITPEINHEFKSQARVNRFPVPTGTMTKQSLP